MTNRLADKLDSNILMKKYVEPHEGSYYNYRVNWVANKLERYQSDCKYYTNPGFVCPLSAYKPIGGLFFING